MVSEYIGPLVGFEVWLGYLLATHPKHSQVTRDVPGIDAAFLAIDTDDAVEFVWNEVRYSNRKVVKESKVRAGVWYKLVRAS